MKRLILVILLISACSVYSESRDWMVLTGYGESHRSWGDTKQHVETFDLVLRHSSRFKNTGRDWFRGSHNFLIELPLHIVTNPDTSPIFAMNFISCWKLEVSKKIEPYMFIGGGPVYTEAGIPGMGNKINGNYQTGLGLYFNTEDGQQFAVEWRYHHISNASTANPNDPLNSSKYLIGISLPF